MKKIILSLLLVAVALSCYACGTTGTTTPPGPGCKCPPPSFPVNDPVIIHTPQEVTVPGCLLPKVPVQVCVCPPKTTPPKIDCPVIYVPEVTPPPVVAPPPVLPPQNVYIPPPPQPKICPPKLPPVDTTTPTVPSLPDIPLPPPALPVQPTLSNKFTLTFQYACRQGVDFDSCLGNILWNDVIIFSIVPTDYVYRSYSIVVTAKVGQNKLQVEGAGKSDSLGLIVDNFKLVRQFTTLNILVNGGFDAPHVGLSWGIYNDIQGWKGVGIEIGYGIIYSTGIQSQVAELDGNDNYIITQYFYFDSDYEIDTGISCAVSSFPGQSLTYKLEFDYAARQNGVSSFFTSRADVVWNDVVVASLAPTDYNVYHHTVYVQLKAGHNSIQFDAASTSDSYGLTIDNVKLTSVYDATNLITNGAFETPYVGAPNFWAYFAGGVYGWKAVKAELGHGQTVYNHYWPASTNQVAELDTDANNRYTQIITISQIQFSKLLVQKATVDGTTVIQNHLSSETAQVGQDVAGAVAIIQGGIQIKITLAATKFNQYVCQLYKRVGVAVKGLKDNQLLELKKFDCLSKAYIGKYGYSYETDFDDGFFDATNLHDWEGYIKEINGKIIKCIDLYGQYHYLQIAPCTHWEGQFPLPVLGMKIFWKGAQQPCGKTYVKLATTCNC